jgi:hypothetical protein
VNTPARIPARGQEEVEQTAPIKLMGCFGLAAPGSISKRKNADFVLKQASKFPKPQATLTKLDYPVRLLGLAFLLPKRGRMPGVLLPSPSYRPNPTTTSCPWTSL